MENSIKKQKGTTVLNGMTFKKNGKVWCVTSSRIISKKRKINNVLFANDKLAMIYFSKLVKDFEAANKGNIEIRKNEHAKNRIGEITKADKTYVLNNNEWDRQTFHVKLTYILDEIEDSDSSTDFTDDMMDDLFLSEMPEDKNNEAVSVLDYIDDDVIDTLADAGYNLDYLNGMTQNEIENLYRKVMTA